METLTIWCPFKYIIRFCEKQGGLLVFIAQFTEHEIAVTPVFLGLHP